MADLQQQITDLTKRAQHAETNHEAAQAKTRVLQKEYDMLKRCYDDYKSKVAELEAVLQPSIDDYEQLRDRRQQEQQLKDELLKLTQDAVQEKNKIEKQNKLLKRQSAKIISMATNIDFAEVLKEEEEEEHKEGLRSNSDSVRSELDKVKAEQIATLGQLTDMTKERDAVKMDLTQAKTMLSEEQQKHQKTKMTLEQTEKLVREIDEVSQKAKEEFERMKHELEEERHLRNAAVKLASETKGELKVKEAEARQSQMMILDMAPDEKLLKATAELEQMAKQLEEQRQMCKKHLGALEEKVSTIRKLNEEVSTLEKDKKHVEIELREVKGRLDSLLAPPPPPPLPSGPQIIKTLKEMVAGNKNKKPTPKPRKDSRSMNQILDELMKRFEEGRTLPRSAKQRPSLPGGFKENGESDQGFVSAVATLRRVPRQQPQSNGNGVHKENETGSSFDEVRGLLSTLKKRSFSQGDLFAGAKRSPPGSDSLPPVPEKVNELEKNKVFAKVTARRQQTEQEEEVFDSSK